MKIETMAVHSGTHKQNFGGAVIAPIFQSSTYEYTGEKSYDDVKYIRINNTPTQLAVAEALAALEGGEAAVVTSSGMSAITTALLALVGPGEHLIAQENLYGGTFSFLRRDFEGLGREVTLVSPGEFPDVSKYLKKNTKVLYVESIANPLLSIPDFRGVTEFAKSKGLISLIDNTFPSPVNFNPIARGFDVVLHSATKYLNGHTDLVAGVIVSTKKILKMATPLLNHLGGTADPHTCYMLHRGLKTLVLRVRQQNESAGKLARVLEGHPKVAQLYYPGLTSHPHHQLAKEYFRGFGGMLSFEYRGSASEADQMMKRLKFAAIAPSLGGVETLITRPVTTSHSGISPEDLQRLGIKDTLVRVSVGIEAVDDLVDDFVTALGNQN